MIRFRNILLVVPLLLSAACEEYTPKPRGFFRIEPPKAEYTEFGPEKWPFSFYVSNQANINVSDSSKFMFEANYKDLNAELYCSYLKVDRSKIEQTFNESRELVARQAEQASAIKEMEFVNEEENVRGYMFLIEGNTVAPIQFSLTDNENKFFRGALYFNCPINADSLKPVVDYLQKDVEVMIESFKWNK